MKISRSNKTLLVLLCLCIVVPVALSACNEDAVCRQALKDRDAQIKQLQLAIVDLSNQLKGLRSVLQMKQKEVGIFKDAPITSSEDYKKCRRRADRLQARLNLVEKERDDYKVRYQALKKSTQQSQ